MCTKYYFYFLKIVGIETVSSVPGEEMFTIGPKSRIIHNADYKFGENCKTELPQQGPDGEIAKIRTAIIGRLTVIK